jgi:RNase adapter protein RapZ
MNASANAAPPTDHRVVCVTGPSGAGRSTAINALEDLGYEAIANMPLALVPRLFEGTPLWRPVALGIDARTRGFSVEGFLDLADSLDRDPRIMFSLLYLDCTVEGLLRRYSETRRRHPAAPAEHPAQGIAHELGLLEPIRQRADFLINTAEMTPHDLRAEVGRWFARGENTGLAVSVHSFSYKRGMPRGLDMVFDCRFLRNPYWEDALRDRDGRDPEVADYVSSDPRFEPFLERLYGLTELLLPAHAEEGKAHLAIGFGCTGGQHRSVMMAETLAETLAQAGWQVSKRHRELERRLDGETGVRTG